MRLARTGSGSVRRDRPLRFVFDGQPLVGLEGDTLASALLANDVRVVGHSVDAGRPRGIVAAGAEEPNAFVQVTIAGASEPMLQATRLELWDGLCATSLRGKGRAVAADDAARFVKVYAHTDVLVVGSGPAGLAAAREAARTGARVILVEDDTELGGSLLRMPAVIDGMTGLEWVAAGRRELEQLPEVRVLTRAVAFGAYDGGCTMVQERVAGHNGADGACTHVPLPHQRLWEVQARQTVLATGAHERPLVFADNDRPGIMLASAVQAYVHRFGVAPAGRVLFFTNNDSAYPIAAQVAAAGIDVPAVLDCRSAAECEASATWRTNAEALRAGGIDVRVGQAVVGTSGECGVDAALVAPITPDGALRAGGAGVQELACDGIAVSGGFNPVVNLYSQRQGRLRYDAAFGSFLPHESVVARVRVAGAVAGTFDLSSAIQQGVEAGAEAARAAGFPIAGRPTTPRAEISASVTPGGPLLIAGLDGGWSHHYVDPQRDSSVQDVARALNAGLRSVEHLKRYTTIGTGSDQGKLSNVLAWAVAATLRGDAAGPLGTTTSRPPYVPVPFALLAGRRRGARLDPVRVTALHAWHVAHGAIFEDVGQWKRPRYFPRDGETMSSAVQRECRAARRSVALMDASTLGKIDVQGPDAAEFLNRLYTNAIASLPVGSIRYAVLCRADGMVFDDGVVMRLAPEQFLVTTTTGNAAAVLEWMEEWLQTEWPGLRVRLTSVTDHWATIAVVGPRSRAVLGRVAPDLSLDRTAFPFMTWREGIVAGVSARVCRVTFSGELAFEIYVPWWHALDVWEAVTDAGADFGIMPYGTESMHVLRAEKGYVIAGQDTDGTVSPHDLGMDWVISKKKRDFIGRRSLRRSDTARPDRKQFVGLLPVDPEQELPEGTQLLQEPPEGTQLLLAPPAGKPARMLGHVTSSYRSAVLGRTFALALLQDGRARHGSRVYAPVGDRLVVATVTDTVFYDPENTRRDA